MPPRVRKRKVCSCCDIPPSTLTSSQQQNVPKRQRVQKVSTVPQETVPVLEHVADEPVHQSAATSPDSAYSNSFTLSNVFAREMEEMNEDIVHESTGHSTRRIRRRACRTIRGLDAVHTFITEVTYTISSAKVDYTGQELTPFQARPDFFKISTPASSTVPEKTSASSAAPENASVSSTTPENTSSSSLSASSTLPEQTTVTDGKEGSQVTTANQRRSHSLNKAFYFHENSLDSEAADSIMNMTKQFVSNDRSEARDTNVSNSDSTSSNSDSNSSNSESKSSSSDSNSGNSESNSSNSDSKPSNIDSKSSNSDSSSFRFKKSVCALGGKCEKHKEIQQRRCTCYTFVCKNKPKPKPCLTEIKKLHLQASLTDGTGKKEHDIVQEVNIGNQGSTPCIYLYTNELLTICNRQQHNIRLDRTFNLGPCLVTAFVFRNSNLLYKKPQNSNMSYGPLMTGPVMLHFDKTPETYARFFETICEKAGIVKNTMSEIEMKDMYGVQKRDKVITRPMRKVFGRDMRLADIHHVPIHLRTDLRHGVSCYSRLARVVDIIADKFSQERTQTRLAIAGAEDSTWSLHQRTENYFQRLGLSTINGKLQTLDRLSLECW